MFRYTFKLLAPSRFKVQFIGHFQSGNIKIDTLDKIINQSDIEIACNPTKLKQEKLACSINIATAGSIELSLAASSYPVKVELQLIVLGVFFSSRFILFYGESIVAFFVRLFCPLRRRGCFLGGEQNGQYKKRGN